MARKGRTKRRGRIRIEQKAQLVHKNDKTAVKQDTIGTDIKKAPSQVVLPNNAATLKVKIRRK